MNYDLFAYIKILLRWSWLTLILVGATVGVIVYTSANAAVVYTSTVRLQVSAPEPEEVALYDTVRSGSTRDEISAVQSNFSQIARGLTAAYTTVQDLGLSMSPQDLAGRVMNEIPSLSDYVYIHVTADNPDDARKIADVHVENSLRIYGEARARTTSVRKEFINKQLATSAQKMTAARDALLRFQISNGTADLTRDIQGYQDNLRSLRVDRDRNMAEIERLSAVAAYYTQSAQRATAENDNAASSYRGQAAANQAALEGVRATVSRQNEIIEQREKELLAMVSLSGEYNRLVTDLRQAENSVTFLEGKVTEAEIKESDARSAGNIQIIERASRPVSAKAVATRNVLLPGVAASLGVGLILSFILEYLRLSFQRRRAKK